MNFFSNPYQSLSNYFVPNSNSSQPNYSTQVPNTYTPNENTFLGFDSYDLTMQINQALNFGNTDMINNVDGHSLLTDLSPRASQPTGSKVVLKEHQLAMLYKCQQIEEKTDFPYGVMKDRPGAGKTYVILAMIYNSVLKDKTINNDGKSNDSEKIKANIIVVPQNIYSQWILSIQTFSTEINYLTITNYEQVMQFYQSSKVLNEYDIILITSSYYHVVATTIKSLDYNVKRVIFDEIDSISSFIQASIPCERLWFVSASFEKGLLGIYSKKITQTQFDECVCQCTNDFIDGIISLEPPIKKYIYCKNIYIDKILESVASHKELKGFNAMDFTLYEQYMESNKAHNEKEAIDLILKDKKKTIEFEKMKKVDEMLKKEEAEGYLKNKDYNRARCKKGFEMFKDFVVFLQDLALFLTDFSVHTDNYIEFYHEEDDVVRVIVETRRKEMNNLRCILQHMMNELHDFTQSKKVFLIFLDIENIEDIGEGEDLLTNSIFGYTFLQTIEIKKMNLIKTIEDIKLSFDILDKIRTKKDYQVEYEQRMIDYTLKQIEKRELKKLEEEAKRADSEVKEIVENIIENIVNPVETINAQQIVSEEKKETDVFVQTGGADNIQQTPIESITYTDSKEPLLEIKRSYTAEERAIMNEKKESLKIFFENFKEFQEKATKLSEYIKDFILSMESTKKIEELEKNIDESEEKIQTSLNKINNLMDRLNSNKMCPVCYEPFEEKTHVYITMACCKNKVCCECTEQWYNSGKNSCLYCNTNGITLSRLEKFENEDFKKFSETYNDETTIGLEEYQEKKKQIFFEEVKYSKSMYLDKFIQKISSEPRKVIIFSDYSAVFDYIAYLCGKYSVDYTDLDKGKMEDIDKAVDFYKFGNAKILLSNSNLFGCGMNFENSTDIIFLHKMHEDMENQVIGRAQRYGRKGTLNIYYLFYDNEKTMDMNVKRSIGFDREDYQTGTTDFQSYDDTTAYFCGTDKDFTVSKINLHEDIEGEKFTPIESLEYEDE